MTADRASTAYVRRTGRLVAPFDDPPGEVRVLNRSLAERQREALAACSIRNVVDVDDLEDLSYPCVLLADHLFVTRTLLEEFLAAARARGGPARLAIAPSVFVELTVPLQQLRRTGDGGALYDLWYLDAPPPVDLEEVAPLAVDPRETIDEPRLPPQFINDATPTLVSVTSRQAMHVTHWALIQRVNLAAFVATIKDLWERRPVYIAVRFLVDKLIGRWRRVRFSRIGRRCEIHPTAVVEGSWLGDGVRVGAGAIVQGSVVGDGAIVEEGAILNLSVVGHRTWIGRKAVLFMTVLYDDVFCGHRLTQACLIGHRSCTTGGGFIIDMNFTGPVKVLQDGRVVSAGTNFLGACLGHDVTMGTGIWIQAGRQIPNGAFLIRSPRGVLSRVPEHLEPGAVMMVEGGGLEPLE